MINPGFVATAAVLIALTCAPSPLHGSEAGQSYILQVYDIEDGLSDNNVKAVFCDSRGIVWIGTQSGVDRFEGSAIRHVNVPGRRFVSVIEGSIFEDPQGNIIVGTAGCLLRIRPDGTVEDVFEADISRRAIQDSGGDILTPSLTKGLCRISASDGSVVKYPYRCLSVAADSGGTLYVLGPDGLISKFDPGTGSAEPWVEIPQKFFKISACRNFLFLFAYGESAVLDFRTGRCLDVQLPNTGSVTEGPGNTVLLTAKEGIFKMDENLCLKKLSIVSIADVLPQNSGYSICMDKSGGIWCATPQGAVHLSANSCNLLPVDVPSGARSYIINTGRDGKIWIAAANYGVYGLDPVSGKIENVHFPDDRHEIRSLYPDGDKLWISFWDHSDYLHCLDVRTGTFTVPAVFPEQADNVLHDSSGRFWIGSRVESGYVYDGFFTKTNPSHYSTIVEDRSGAVWTGVKTHGITRHSPDGATSNYERKFGNFKSDGLVDLLVGNDGAVWAVTEGDGLFRYDGESDSFVLKTDLRGCDFGRIYSAIVDSSGNILLFSTGGVIIYDQNSGNWTILVPDTVFGHSSQKRSVCIGKDDAIYVSSRYGVFRFDEMPACSDTLERVLFTSISGIPSVNGQPPQSFPCLKISDREMIDLPHRSNSFRITVADPDFSLVKTYRLVYSLRESPAGDWQPVQNGEVSFIGLPTGTYRLSVRAMNYDGTFLGEGRKLTIRIRPHPLASPAAFIVYALLLTFILMTIIRVATRNSERKAAEALALQNAENEKNIYAAKIEFLSCIAHEIKTPLSLVKLPVESLTSRFSGTKDRYLRDDIETLGRNADILCRLVDELIDLQKIEKLSFTLSPEPRDLCLLSREIAEGFQRLFSKRKLEFILALPEDPCISMVDVPMFTKLLSSLMMNAAKYSSSYVRFSLFVDGDCAVFKTENDGVIVPLEKRESIFRAFVRYQDGKHTVGGAGIGLYSSSKFAEMLGGSLSMDSDPTVNRFVLTLPVRKPDPETAAQPSSQQDLVVPVKFPYRVLVVEDNEDMRRFIGRILEGEYEVSYASDGQEALEVISEGKLPSVVISDVLMPRLDGFEFCRRLKSDNRYSAVPVILITAKYGDDSRIQAFESGACSYLMKPFSIEVLKAALRSVLDDSPGNVSFEAQSLDNVFLSKVTEYLSAHLSDCQILNESLASYASVSPSSLHKKMKRITGLSPAEYVLEFRLKEAVHMMSDKDLPLSEISVMAGFSSPSYFSTCFRRKYGVSPAAWRKNQ